MKTKALWLMALPIALIFGTSCQKDSSFSKNIDSNQSSSIQINSLTTNECSVVKDLKGIGENSVYGTFKVTDMGEDLEVTITAKAGFYILNADVVW
ncbi:MAG TPA: hypothetical protein VGC29_10330, partial [Flavisolibacter sp.]